ncbi:MAG: sugar ABC transporter substrate-binding protein [Caldilineaceae bacterium]|nr:sugar ABC transporter substrate-binding protein [Caldilineaceae bacterium]
MVIGYTLPWGIINAAAKAFYDTVEDWAQREGVILKSVAVGEDVQKQTNIIQDWVASGTYDGILMIPVSSDAMTAAVEIANDANVLVACMDRTVSGGNVVATVTSDNFACGKLTGEEAVKLLTQKYGSPKGKVLELQGDLAAEIITLRQNGFDTVLAEYPDIQLLQKPTNFDQNTAYSATMDALASNSDIDLIFWQSDIIAVSAVAAINDSGRLVTRDDPNHIFLVGIDGQTPMLEYIEQGYADGVANQALLAFGYSVKFLKDAWEGKPTQVGDVIVQEGEYWSPATITQGTNGPELLLPPLWVDESNASDPTLWGWQKVS